MIKSSMSQNLWYLINLPSDGSVICAVASWKWKQDNQAKMAPKKTSLAPDIVDIYIKSTYQYQSMHVLWR